MAVNNLKNRDLNPHVSVDCVIFGFDFQELNDLVYKTESNEEKRALILIIRKLKG